MNKKKAVFLDRDGTIVIHEPYLSSPDQLKLLPNAAEGIRLFKESGYLVIVITNQSGIARGFFDEEHLVLIHKKLMRMLEEEGITIDDIYKERLYGQHKHSLYNRHGLRRKRLARGCKVVCSLNRTKISEIMRHRYYMNYCDLEDNDFNIIDEDKILDSLFYKKQ